MNAALAKLNAMDLSEDESVHDDDVEDVESSSEEEEEAEESSSEEDDESEEMEEDEEEDIVASASEDDEDEDDTSSMDDDTDVTSKPRIQKKRKQKDKWLKDIRKYQATTELLIPKNPFKRLVREVAQDFKDDLRFSEEAFLALQTASEEFLIELLSNTNKITIARGQDTIMPKDMLLVLDIINSMKGWSGKT